MSDIFAVLVLYGCNLEDSHTFQTLSASLNACGEKMNMLVYDNTPYPQYHVSNFSINNIDIEYISDISNPGVSKAYNMGARLAEQKRKKWLLLLDQDTCFPVDAMEKYIRQSQAGMILSAPVLMVDQECISPCRYQWGRGTALKNYTLGVNMLKNRSLLNSGLLVPLDMFISVGGYNECIPLDFSDHCFIDSVKREYKNFYLLNIICKHGLSVTERNVDKVLNRFRFYLIGAKEYVHTHGSYGILLVVFLRTLKLSIRYSSFKFFRCYFHMFLNHRVKQ